MNISKQLVESGTALQRNYSNDIFFSTRVKIILCLAGGIGIIALMFFVVLDYTKKTLMGAMIDSLRLTVATGVSDPSILAGADNDVEMVMYATITLTVLLGLLVGLLLSRLALVPVGQAFNMQKQFVSGIAHELRTPLSLLRVNNELARFEERDGTVHAVLFDENIADIDRINEVLNNLLLFDRMTALHTLRFEEVDVSTILETITTRLRPLSELRRVSLHLPHMQIPRIAGNPKALEQVFFNVLKNALMYTKAGGTVTFQYRGVTDTLATIAITDTGVGIPEKDLGHIFEPFYRTEKTGKLSGTGIGLAIVYEIIKMHKGKIEVESIEGVGTTFIISLPVLQTERAISSPLGTSASKIYYNFSDSERT